MSVNLKQKIFGTSSIETGVALRHDLNHRFNLQRKSDPDGFDYYLLTNTSRKDGIKIKRELFDRFRHAICEAFQLKATSTSKYFS